MRMDGIGQGPRSVDRIEYESNGFTFSHSFPLTCDSVGAELWLSQIDGDKTAMGAAVSASSSGGYSTRVPR